MAVGPGAWNLATGKRIPVELEVGDLVMVGDAHLAPDEFKEEELALVNDNDVLVVYDKAIMEKIRSEQVTDQKRRFEVVT